MKTIEAMRGKESEILSHYDINITNNKHIDCDLCGSKKSLRINIFNSDLSYICKCGSGHIINYIQERTGQTFKSIANEIDRIIGNTQNKQDKASKEKVNLVEKVTRKFLKLEGLRGTTGEEYLNERGIYSLPRQGVRFNPLESVNGKRYQSLFAIASNNNHEPKYLHRTLLDGNKKALVETQRKMLTLKDAANESISIKLFPISEALGVAEGIETALAANQLYKANTWATINTSFLKKFKAPNSVKHLIIYADSDKNGAGHAAAFECANKNILAANDVERVTVVWPESGDFNDVLLEGKEVYEWRFDKR